MPSDNFGSNQPPQSPSLPSLVGGGSSLAQSARMKHLNTARGVMYVLGVLNIGIGILFFNIMPKQAVKKFDEELQQLQRQGLEINQEKAAELREAEVRGQQIAAG